MAENKVQTPRHGPRGGGPGGGPRGGYGKPKNLKATVLRTFG